MDFIAELNQHLHQNSIDEIFLPIFFPKMGVLPAISEYPMQFSDPVLLADIQTGRNLFITNFIRLTFAEWYLFDPRPVLQLPPCSDPDV